MQSLPHQQQLQRQKTYRSNDRQTNIGSEVDLTIGGGGAQQRSTLGIEKIDSPQNRRVSMNRMRANTSNSPENLEKNINLEDGDEDDDDDDVGRRVRKTKIPKTVSIHNIPSQKDKIFLEI